MQTEDTRNLEGAGASLAGATRGLLENSHRVAPNRLVLGPERDQVTIYAHGVPTALLERHINTLELAVKEPLFVAAVLDFQRLYWTHTGALLRLQGDTVYNIIGSAACVLRGKHLPVWHPRPGMEDVRIVVPRVDPRGLSPVDVFQLASQLGF
jgi:hypothetical protein